MKSFKMKSLALAVLGLASFAVAGSAFAVCPAVAALPWSGGASALGGGTLAVSGTGLDGSACKLDATLGTDSADQATVTDTSPANEPRYRFQFLVNASALGALASTDSVNLLTTSGATTVHGRRGIIAVNLVPAASGNRLSFNWSCNNGTTYRCTATTGAITLAAGVNRIEFDVLMATSGANGSIRYWINAPSGTTEPAVSGSVTGIDNSAWVGAKTTTMGLASPSPTQSSGHSGQIVSFDTFDSRRQTYIGY
ncbi:hypothetical protein ELE36_13930 [Pseudolysobacter antarcticus]|uniref:IPT/TIG domain-containing protein n=1 Tax=Pseudolysobacter antarcticus TaxID=2511995 RepID=A0A411HLI5_9GAMM|nr:hypothetical protein [Pseudolysobacter antarcticus]QBB71363.1 hypothetical protein ELE36_13930 [Pseudolysobacter antarcticus]